MRFWPRKKVSTIDPTTAVQDDPLILREARAIAPKANSGKGPGKYFGEVVIPQSQINIAGDMVREMSGLADKMAAAQRKAELDNQVAEALLEGAQAIARSKERTEVLFNEEVVDKLRKSFEELGQAPPPMRDEAEVLAAQRQLVREMAILTNAVS